jgi:glyoxylase-like metal-dependent hydrolase (beta-lactamase superfamily II)
VSVTEVATEVWRAGTRWVNWYLLPYVHYPATLGFVVHAVANGARYPRRGMPATAPLVAGPNPQIPGCPVVTHTPGHTDGSCVIEFKSHGVVFVGDALCTASPLTGLRVPPQLQTRAPNRNSSQALASVERLAGVEAPVVLPGHGQPWREGVAAAAASARKIGCR